MCLSLAAPSVHYVSFIGSPPVHYVSFIGSPPVHYVSFSGSPTCALCVFHWQPTCALCVFHWQPTWALCIFHWQPTCASSSHIFHWQPHPCIIMCFSLAAHLMAQDVFLTGSLVASDHFFVFLLSGIFMRTMQGNSEVETSISQLC